MADVQIQQGGGHTWVWAIVVLVLIAILAYVFLGRGGETTDVEVKTPTTQEPATPTTTP